MKIKTNSVSKEKNKIAPPILEGRIISPGGDNLSKENSNQNRFDKFTVEVPSRALADLILPDEKMQQIKALLTKIKYHHVLYEDFGLNKVDPEGGRTTINLYGPPGTGKSFAAEAIAHELDLYIIRVNYAEVESKFVGETAKNINAAFKRAKAENAVLFFDEADSILGRRLSNVQQSTDHAVNISRSVMLLELDRFSGVTIFATNLASNYDKAFVRRILGHIEMPLPEKKQREELWNYLIPRKMPVHLNEAEWKRLLIESDGLSGGDILNSVINAASAALEREGPNCKIRLKDFLKAVTSVKKAKKEIG